MTLAVARALSTINELRDHIANVVMAGQAVRQPIRLDYAAAQDATYGLRWIEIVSGNTWDSRRSLVREVPRNWVNAAGVPHSSRVKGRT